MRYMVAHMIEGEAKEYLENLSRVFAKFYKFRPSTANIDAHLTMKAPFDALSTDLFDVERTLDRYTRVRSPLPYTLRGFSTFHDKVVYMNVEAPDDTKELFTGLKDEFKTIPWLEFKPHEDETTLHATICYPRTKEQCDEIITKLNERGGKTFECTIDKVALLKKGDRRWEVYKEYKLGGNDDTFLAPPEL